MKQLFNILILVLLAAVGLVSCGGGGGGGGEGTPAAQTSKLPKTGQIVSYDTNTVKTDDGALQEGVAWPSQRFSVASSGTGTVVTDNLTGLMWPQDASTPTFTGTTSTCTGGALTWQGALDYVSCLNTNSYLGHTDWRLPNRKELRSLADYSKFNLALPAGQPFTNVQIFYDYWSSTTFAFSTPEAVIVGMIDGSVSASGKINVQSVWPVRDAAITATVLLPKTGQIVSYDTNTVKADDGALQEGVAWPSPRFSVASSGTETVVTDNLTGLMWPQDASTPTFTGTSSTCTGGTLTWQGGLDYVSCLNTNSYLGHTDWRLPNVNELESLIDASTSSPALPAGHPFTKVQASYYWSSTTYAGNTSLAFSVHVGAGYVYEYNKTTTNYYVWPIRSGQ